VVGGCNSLPEAGEKWPKNYHKRPVAAGLVGPWGMEKEERIREEVA